MPEKNIPFKLDNERYFIKDSGFMSALHYLHENYPLHWHEFYEIEYVVSGHASEIINGSEYEVAPGFAVLITPADLHSYQNVRKEDSLTIYNVKFSPYLLPPELQKMLNGISEPLCGICPEIGPIFGKLLTEYNNRSFGREQFIISAITQICILLFRCCEQVSRSTNDPEHKMVMYIREHYLEPISAKSVAECFHLSPNYFSEFFKKHTGIGFSAYVKKLRLKFAAKLLLTSDMTVNEVAVRSGFNSMTYFFNSFKSAYGMPPEQFRNNAIKHSQED